MINNRRKIQLIIFISPMLFLAGIKIEKDLIYNQYTLEDAYTYQKKKRAFQWDKISLLLDSLNNFVASNVSFATLVNYKNRNGAPSYTSNNSIDEYGWSQDKYGVARSQSVPLYDMHNNSVPVRYSRDGAFVALVGAEDMFYLVEHFIFDGVWRVPKKYVMPLYTTTFNKTIFIDRKNQNIATLERADSVWMVRSMNPATTGLRKPPHKRATPLGAYVLQNKLVKMFYYVDGTQTVGGYSPFASRFSGGAYIHGVPVDLPRTEPIEYSWSLGTTPRSHMCVRNATSHAKFIFDWGEINKTLIFVIE